MKQIKIAFIDNSIDSSVYDPVRHWKAHLDVEWEAFKATESCFPDFKKGFTHLILTGSEASILEREDWVYEESEVILEAVEKNLAILGSCWGHQLLAFVLRGPSQVRRSPHPEVGWIPVQIKKKNSLLGYKRQAFSFSIHFDEVVDLGSDFDILASSEYCSIQAFRLKNNPIWGIQIHPEINIREGHMLLKNLISLQLKTTPFFEEALMQRPKDSGLIRLIIKNFLASKSQII